MDLKVFGALGVFGTCAITALTAQNTVAVRGAWEAPAELVTAQIEAVLDDLPVKAAKTGMLSSEAVVRAVANVVAGREFPPLVLDPVVLAKDGSALLSEAGVEAVRDLLLPRALIVTPNAPEAEALTGVKVESEDGAAAAAKKLRSLGCRWVLVKGGHLRGREVTDLLLGPDVEQAITSPRVSGGPFHGTGCALSAAITAHLAHGQAVLEAVRGGLDFVQELVRRSLQLGSGARVLHPKPTTSSKGKQP
jgi:hydroxymethylpyrimidine/phosphomethylpyrimidine kinase